jgi:hypothetical protein
MIETKSKQSRTEQASIVCSNFFLFFSDAQSEGVRPRSNSMRQSGGGWNDADFSEIFPDGRSAPPLPWCPSRWSGGRGASPRWAYSRCRASRLLRLRSPRPRRPTDARLPSGNCPDAISEAVGEAVAPNEYASGHHAASERRGGSIHPRSRGQWRCQRREALQW